MFVTLYSQSFFSLPFRFGRKSVVSSEEVNVYKRLGKETMSGESLREPLNLGTVFFLYVILLALHCEFSFCYWCAFLC